MSKWLILFLAAHLSSWAAEIGTPDPAFTPQIEWKPGNRYITLMLQPDGKILLSGSLSRLNGAEFKGVARLNTDGSTDSGFTPPDGISEVYRFHLGADGYLYLAGWFTYQNRTVMVDKLAFDGTRDTAFHGWGSLTGHFMVLADGSMIFTGDFTSLQGGSSPYLAKKLADGSLDPNFHPPTRADMALSTHYANLHPLSGGKFLAAGFLGVTNNFVYNIHRFYLDGRLDTSFLAEALDAGRVRTSVVLPNEKIIFDSTHDDGLRKLKANGSRDTTFKHGAPLHTQHQPLRFAVAPDGKIACIVMPSTDRPTPLLRLQQDGAIDSTFNAGTGPSHWIGDFPPYPSLVVEQNGDILIGGSFTQFNGKPSQGLERIKGNLLPTLVKHEVEDGRLRLTVVGNKGANINLKMSEDLVSWTILNEVVLENNQQDLVVDIEKNLKFFKVD